MLRFRSSILSQAEHFDSFQVLGLLEQTRPRKDESNVRISEPMIWLISGPPLAGRRETRCAIFDADQGLDRTRGLTNRRLWVAPKFDHAASAAMSAKEAAFP